MNLMVSDVQKMSGGYSYRLDAASVDCAGVFHSYSYLPVIDRSPVLLYIRQEIFNPGPSLFQSLMVCEPIIPGAFSALAASASGLLDFFSFQYRIFLAGQRTYPLTHRGMPLTCMRYLVFAAGTHALEKESPDETRGSPLEAFVQDRGLLSVRSPSCLIFRLKGKRVHIVLLERVDEFIVRWITQAGFGLHLVVIQVAKRGKSGRKSCTTALGRGPRSQIVGN